MTPANVAPLPRLVASDMGGTLVPPGGDRVPAATLTVLDLLMERGIPVALITGFNLKTARRMLTGLRGTPWLLVQNGTTCLRNQQVLWEHGLAAPVASALVRALEEMEVPVVVYRDLSRGGAPEYRGFGRFHRGSPFIAVDSFSDFSGVTGVSTRVKNAEVGKVQALLESLHPAGARLILSRGPSRTWLEVTPAGARKDRALQRLCTELGIPAERVIFFGDNLNDLEALEMVGFPRVVEDALPSLRESFPRVRSSSEQGPARELARIFRLSPAFLR